MTEPGRRPRLRTKERREEILAAALDLFGRRSFDSVGMRDVAAACDLSATGIYRHFPSKDALPIGLFDRLSDKLSAAMRDASRKQTPRLALEHLIRFHVGMALREPAMVPIYQREEAALPPQERERFRQLLRDYLAAWTDTLMRLDPGLTYEVARTTVVAAFGTINGIWLHRSGLSQRALEQLVTNLAWRTLGQSATQ